MASILYYRPMQSPEQAPPYTRIPDELQDLPQWVNWRREDGRKIPVNPHTLGNAGVNWPGTWADFDQARDTAMQRQLGLGFVLTVDDPYTCVDLDDCVRERGQIDLRTRQILDLLSGWVELSPSGQGLHIWVKNDRPVSRRTSQIEVYSYGRWMSVTGRSNPRNRLEIPERTEQVATLFEQFMPRVERPYRIPTEPESLDDLEIWQHLLEGDNGEFYSRLYDGDLAACGNDHSLAVIVLANKLAELTDFNPQRMKSLLYETSLVRDKWEEPRGDITWIDYQINDAIAYVSGKQS